MKFPSIFKRNGHKIKERVLKNNENVLDAFSKHVQGKACPVMMGQSCIGNLCMFFTEYKNIDRETKKVTPYWACDYNMTPKLLIELNESIREFIDAIKKGTQ